VIAAGRIPALTGLCLLGAAMAACGRVDEAERATCVAVVPAIEAASRGPIEIVSVEPLRADLPTLHLQYRVGQGAHARGGFLDCAFGPDEDHPGRTRLVGVRSAAGALSPARLFVLERFWLADARARGEGAARLAMPGDGR